MPLFALVDCNNFFVSCERVFQPWLNDKPVVVLSNNDGCVVSRSNEVKRLGIPMGAPYFQYRDQFKAQGVTVFSSNFELYGDVSRRVMRVVADAGLPTEVYSIDEAFLDLSGMRDPLAFVRRLREAINRWVGIPVSIGIGPTKTLAKAASEIAKKDTASHGVRFVESAADRDDVLRHLSIGDVWGIGYRRTPRFLLLGIKTAWDFIQKTETWTRQEMGVQGSRLRLELSGTSAFSIDTQPEPQRSLASTRSFGRATMRKRDVEEAAAYHAAHGAKRLRERGLCASHMDVFLRTARVQGGRFLHAGKKFSVPTADSFLVSSAAAQAAGELFIDTVRFAKAGVVFSGIVPAEAVQQSLFFQTSNRSVQVLSAMDAINKKYGREAVFLAGTGIKREWKMKRDKVSQEYTTHWDELLVVKA